MEGFGGQVSSGYGIECKDNSVDSAGIEIKNTGVNRHDASAGKLFVGGISWETTEETFIEYFSKYGEIADSVIMTDKYSGRPRGFGFVTFVDPANADKVLDEDHVIDGRMVEVKRTVPREHMEGKGVSTTKKIFVGGIPPSLTEDEMKEYFSSYGSIAESQIMFDHKTGRPRGFGFVTFETEDSVERIFSGGKIHELRGKQVEIKKAEPKRAGAEFVGSATNSYGGYAGGGGGWYGRKQAHDDYGGNMDRGHGGYGGFGGYAGSYGGSPADFYGSYGGYGYGYGLGGAMYNGSGYGVGGYGNPSGYISTSGYETNNVFGGSTNVINGSSRGGYGNDSSMNRRYHPYQR